MARKPGEIDWVTIRQEFIETLPKVTQYSLCLKYDINPNYLSEVSSREHWDILRERYISRITEMREGQKAEAIATAGAEWDDACLQAAKKLLQLAIAELEGGKPSEDRPAVPPMHSKDVASSIKVAQDVGRVALGDSMNSSSEGVKVIIESLLMPAPGKSQVLQRIVYETDGHTTESIIATQVPPNSDGSKDT